MRDLYAKDKESFERLIHIVRYIKFEDEEVNSSANATIP